MSLDAVADSQEPDVTNWERAVRGLIADPEKKEIVESCFFDPPIERAAERYRSGPEWAEIRKIIGPASGIALDLGAGNGIVSHALSKDGWSTIAVEPDPSDLVGQGAVRALAASTHIKVDLRSGYGEQLPVTSNSVAVVIARQVLHHARDLDAFCAEIARVLKPGGLLVAARDHVISGPEQLDAFLAGHPLHRFYGGENAFTLVRYREALTSAGLRVRDEFNSFQSPINYAPRTADGLRSAAAERLGILGPVTTIFRIPALMSGTLALLAQFDRRPGRLVTFVCEKPNAFNEGAVA